MIVDNLEITITGRIIKTARLTDEWYQDVEDPHSLVEKLKEARLRADLFTFMQRLPETKRKYEYFTEWDSIAAIPIRSFKFWWEQQINPKVRNMVRKSEKKGVEIRVVEYTDEFIEGMTCIFNESSVRQGRPFWHFGKDFETVKREFSKNLFREQLLGAYYMNELIGFIMLADAGRYAMTKQILGSLRHRDKSPVNALLAKAVQICEEKKLSYLVYASWVDGTLGDFKRHNGFERVDLPRYYIPLNRVGSLVLKAHFHRGVKGIVATRLLAGLKAIRAKWYLNRRPIQNI
jgi:hypothetical protein